MLDMPVDYYIIIEGLGSIQRHDVQNHDVGIDEAKGKRNDVLVLLFREIDLDIGLVRPMVYSI